MNKKILLGLVGLMLISVFITACRIVDASTIPPSRVVEMGSSKFIEETVEIEKGQTLTLVSLAAPHDIANGTWDGSKEVKQVEAGAPNIGLVKIADKGSGTIGPFNTAGEFQLYCVIHPGMNLTVIVK